MSEFNVNRDKWLESHGKKRNEWGNWPNVDIKEFENWAKNNEVAFDIKSILNEYENWADIPDEKKPWSPANIEKMKKAFDAGKKAFDAGKKTVDKGKKTVMAEYKKPTLDDAKKFAQDFLSKNPNADDSAMWDSFLNSIDASNRKLYEKNQLFQNVMKGYRSRLNSENSGTFNDKGDMSKSGNLPAVKLENKLNEMKMQPKTTESAFRIETFENTMKNALENMKGKSAEEQRKIVSDVLSEEKPAIPLPKVEKEAEPALKKTAENIEQAERDKEIDSKSSAFLKSWASTHPSWLKILSSNDLSWGQKVALVGSALANIGANVTLGAKAGFEHGSFSGVPWDFKQAIDRYTENELDTVLKGDQNRRTQVDAGEFWANFRKEHGDKVADELIALGDLYGNNPETLRNRLASMGVYKSADEVKDLYANLEKTKISEEAKRELLETEAKRLENEIKELQKKVSKETAEELIKAQNELNKFNALKSSSDSATYNLEKGAGYIKNAIEVVEGAASTVGGVMTGGVVGGIPSAKDGIIKARGIPQKIVRADGSEVQLDPNDNIYATKNTLTTEKDDGSELVHMSQDDRVSVLQNRLGYSGGFINKDFNYYLSKLRG